MQFEEGTCHDDRAEKLAQLLGMLYWPLLATARHSISHTLHPYQPTSQPAIARHWFEGVVPLTSTHYNNAIDNPSTSNTTYSQRYHYGLLQWLGRHKIECLERDKEISR